MERQITPDGPDPDPARAQPGAPGASTAPRALAGAAAASAGAGGRHPGAVRAVDVHRPLVAPAGSGARRGHARTRTPLLDPGDADALDHPPRLGRGLLGVLARDRGGPPALVGAHR